MPDPTPPIAFRVLDTATGKLADAPLADGQLLDLTPMGDAAKTFTIAADVPDAVLRNGLSLEVFNAGGVLVFPAKMCGLDAKRTPATPRGAKVPLGLGPGQYLIRATPHTGVGGFGKGPLAPIKFNLGIVATVPAPPAPWPPIAPKPTATETTATDFDAWTSGEFVMRRNVRYLATRIKQIRAGASMSIRTEAGDGPPPVLVYVGLNHSAFDFASSSGGFLIDGPLLIDGGGTAKGVTSFFRVRGTGHRFNKVWIGNGIDGWFGSEPAYVGEPGLNGSADVTLTDCGLWAPNSGNTIYTSDANNTGTTHTRWTVERFFGLPHAVDPPSLAVGTGIPHGIRLYGFQDWLMRDVWMDVRASMWKETGALRLHHGDGFRLESSAPGRTFMAAPSFNYIGSLNKPEEKTGRPVRNVTFGTGCLLTGHWDIHYGVENLVWDGVDYHGDRTWPVSVANDLTPHGMGPPTGEFRNVHFYFESTDVATVIAGKYAGIRCVNCTATNPVKGWDNVPLGPDFKPVKP